MPTIKEQDGLCIPAVSRADPGFLERGFIYIMVCVCVCVWGGGGGGGGGLASQISFHLCGQIIYYCILSPLLYCNQYAQTAQAQISFVMIILTRQGPVFFHAKCWPFQFLNENASIFQTWIMFWGVRL